MTKPISLALTGDLYRGGTTENAQVAFIRLNGDAIKSIGREFPFDNPSILRDDVLAILERDWSMDPKRGTKRAIRELICAGQSDEKVQRELRSSVTTRGRKVVARPQVLRSDSTSGPARSPLTQTLGDAEGANVEFLSELNTPSAAFEWPELRTYVKGLQTDEALRKLLLALAKKDSIEDVLRLRSAVTVDWRSQDLPMDVQAALRWAYAYQ